MFDIRNLSKYSNDQIKGQLKSLKSGHRLYWLVTLIFIALSIAFGVASIVMLTLSLFHVKEMTQTMFIVTATLLAFFIPCIIVMLAMIITDKIKYVDKIKAIQAYLKKHNIR